MATKRLYRSRKADILGVCHGFAEWRDLPVSGVQLAAVLIAVFTAVVPALLVYLIIGIILPVNPDEDENGRKTYRAKRDEYEEVNRDKEEMWEEKYRKS